jgi:hypothetical protein
MEHDVCGYGKEHGRGTEWVNTQTLTVTEIAKFQIMFRERYLVGPVTYVLILFTTNTE